MTHDLLRETALERVRFYRGMAQGCRNRAEMAAATLESERRQEREYSEKAAALAAVLNVSIEDVAAKDET